MISTGSTYIIRDRDVHGPMLKKLTLPYRKSSAAPLPSSFIASIGFSPPSSLEDAQRRWSPFPTARHVLIPRTVRVGDKSVVKVKLSDSMVLTISSKVIFPAARTQWGTSIQNSNHAIYVLKSKRLTTWASVRRKAPKFYRTFKRHYRKLVKSDQDFKVYHSLQRKLNRLSENAVMRKVYEEVHRRIKVTAPKVPRRATPKKRPALSNQPTSLPISEKVSLSLLDGALMPAVNAAFGCSFGSGGKAIAFMQKGGYSNWSKTSRKFKQVFASKMKSHLQKNHPKFKAAFDRMYRNFRGVMRDLMQARKMYGVLYSAKVSNAGRLQCAAEPTPPARPVTPRPTPPVPPSPRPADTQLALQQALVGAVRKVYGASTSASSVKTVLKTQKWTTLKQLGIVRHIQEAFRELGYRKAAKSSYLAQRLVKKTLEHWGTSSGTTTPARPTPPPRRVPPRRPATRPVTPTPSQPRPADAQLKLQQVLVAAVRKVYGATTSESSVITVLKTQKWTTLKQLGIASEIQRSFGRLGYAKAARSSRAARRLLRETLRKWK